MILATAVRAPECPVALADGPRLTLGRECKAVAKEFNANPFLYPDDVCFGANGTLYLTDSGDLIDNFAANHKIHLDYLDLDCDGLPLCDGREKGGL